MEDSGEQGASQSQFMNPPMTSPNRPRHINEKALLALPFISIFVGVDELVPTKAVYAIYDATTPGVRFIHGDGLLIEPEQVCFTQAFSTNPAEYSSGQRQHFMELIKRSALQHRSVNFGESVPFQEHFKTPESVREAFTFLSDIDFGMEYPALTQLSQNQVEDSVRGVPCLVISLDPVWTFDPRLGFQPRVLREKEDKIKILHLEFNKRYRRNISLLDFLHAAFCLAGMETLGLISLVHQGQDDGLYESDVFRPRQTSAGWTVDCFLARFAKFETFAEKHGLGSYPNPICWLEAELEDERRRNEQDSDYPVGRPWKGMVDGKAFCPVVGWEMLRGFEWQEYPCSYPRPFAQGSQNGYKNRHPVQTGIDTQRRRSSIGKITPSPTTYGFQKRKLSSSPNDLASSEIASFKSYTTKRKRSIVEPSKRTPNSDYVVFLSDDDDGEDLFDIQSGKSTRGTNKRQRYFSTSPNSPSQKRFKKPADIDLLFPPSPTRSPDSPSQKMFENAVDTDSLFVSSPATKQKSALPLTPQSCQKSQKYNQDENIGSYGETIIISDTEYENSSEEIEAISDAGAYFLKKKMRRLGKGGDKKTSKFRSPRNVRSANSPGGEFKEPMQVDYGNYKPPTVEDDVKAEFWEF